VYEADGATLAEVWWGANAPIVACYGDVQTTGGVRLHVEPSIHRANEVARQWCNALGFIVVGDE
jgi:hypothetical protein